MCWAPNECVRRALTLRGEPSLSSGAHQSVAVGICGRGLPFFAGTHCWRLLDVPGPLPRTRPARALAFDPTSIPCPSDVYLCTLPTPCLTHPCTYTSLTDSPPRPPPLLWVVTPGPSRLALSSSYRAPPFLRSVPHPHAAFQTLHDFTLGHAPPAGLTSGRHGPLPHPRF